ncbi:SDR family oxidoreductase [Acuticoccus mangrovi]|uniref:SDR family oxidoreductase n=1 Tax=Acuticoccus mangrovi TaxID=2796142 RepID=A0A934IQS7_9HYPH|nr:SDR family oxidoreductase [Acuticoccus mangrovi]MBJ3776572.1 SDR family oxidoreductase [Acuticoccus mangrovi]
MSGTTLDLDLTGRAALVTAGSDGLGLACARRLAEAGVKVAICGRDPAKLEAAEASLRAAGAPDALALCADLTDAAAVEGLVPAVTERFGALDILVVNSGHIAYGGLRTLTDAQWHEAFNLLLMSAVRLSRAAIPAMQATGGGDMVFLTSATLQQAAPHLLLSSVFRLGVASLAKSLSHDLAPDGIRVNTVAPGYFDTGRVRARIDEKVATGLSRPEAALEVAGEAPMGRIGEADELAEVVAFVIGGRARFLNGASITIDGAKGRTVL